MQSQKGLMMQLLWFGAAVISWKSCYDMKQMSSLKATAMIWNSCLYYYTSRCHHFKKLSSIERAKSYSLPNLQLLQVDLGHLAAVVARHCRRQRQRQLTRRWRHFRIDRLIRVELDRHGRNVGVRTWRPRNLDLGNVVLDADGRRDGRRRRRPRRSSVKTSRKFSDVRDEVARVATQVRRHFWRRRGHGWEPADGLALRLADVGVERIFKNVRVQRRRRRWRVSGYATLLLLLLQYETASPLPRQGDEVHVLFGVERSSLPLRRAPFTVSAAPGAAGAPRGVGFFDEKEAFRLLLFVSPRFVQRHRDDVEGRTCLGNLKSKDNICT